MSFLFFFFFLGRRTIRDFSIDKYGRSESHIFCFFPSFHRFIISDRFARHGSPLFSIVPIRDHVNHAGGRLGHLRFSFLSFLYGKLRLQTIFPHTFLPFPPIWHICSSRFPREFRSRLFPPLPLSCATAREGGMTFFFFLFFFFRAPQRRGRTHPPVGVSFPFVLRGAVRDDSVSAVFFSPFFFFLSRQVHSQTIPQLRSLVPFPLHAFDQQEFQAPKCPFFSFLSFLRA